jgi:transcription elongation factor Elf1
MIIKSSMVTKFRIQIKCACCNHRDVVFCDLDQDQQMNFINWECPSCHWKRVVQVWRRDLEAVIPRKEPIADRFFKFVKGKRVQTDESFKPIEKERHEVFSIFYGKKKKAEILPSAHVEKMEDD